jgi:hypothetical protein
MKKQLINEAKRLQELAGIKEESNLAPVVYTFHNPNNPNEKVKYQDPNTGKYIMGTKAELMAIEGTAGVDTLELIDYKSKPGKPVMSVVGGDAESYIYGLKEGDDFIFVPAEKIEPLQQAYDNDMYGINGYLYDNDFELETGTNEWMDLVEIVGEENMSEYIDFIENTLKINIF